MDQIYRERNAALANDLESGQFEQGHHFLHRITTSKDGTVKHAWCCLAVAAVRAEKDGVNIRREVPPEIEGETYEHFGSSISFPPQNVADYYGWSSTDPELIAENGKRINAAQLNDSGDEDAAENPYNFRQIAAAFRRTFCEGP